MEETKVVVVAGYYVRVFVDFRRDRTADHVFLEVEIQGYSQLQDLSIVVQSSVYYKAAKLSEVG